MHGAGPGAEVSDWVPWRELAPGAIAIDVVYNPRVTPFLAAADAAGVVHRGGLGMLVRQAALALGIWLDKTEGWIALDLAQLEAAADAALSQLMLSRSAAAGSTLLEETRPDETRTRTAPPEPLEPRSR
jgi:shikimate 5-dehydrogenase